ncbi:GNAT family N-acetyltransferase [Marinitenerispora sediminis]|uniref:GNAT family N-acetyltransferase n=1 Tax=Marinitenerispora sediminis TaxID=1931232 RepID=A0A368TA41_9ACTN|nr:GNAT family N-acetyltransferase [Marinitenerispora sediminis]RCV51667.1 GNAT family N-acetyltransferase [Marinitenerispora sediminis]RCV59465.1 GNAT family N-acetyltransferase [Marinitenerispora sediminis]RCV61702.1 GNAT family N-acetyltransferase [Marinitenerispora sediminis]
MVAPAPAVAIEPATAADVGEIWTLQRAAYVTEAQGYGDPYIAPLTETAAQIRAALGGGPLLKAVAGRRIVGAVRGRSTGPTFLVNRLAVAPDRQGEGIGRALLLAIEAHARAAYPDLEAFALFTGHSSDGNLRLYRRLGYTETSRERVAEHLTFVHLRKPAREPVR